MLHCFDGVFARTFRGRVISGTAVAMELWNEGGGNGVGKKAS